MRRSRRRPLPKHHHPHGEFHGQLSCCSSLPAGSLRGFKGHSGPASLPWEGPLCRSSIGSQTKSISSKVVGALAGVLVVVVGKILSDDLREPQKRWGRIWVCIGIIVLSVVITVVTTALLN